MNIHIFKSSEAKKIANEIKNKDKIIETACNAIFKRIEEAAHEGETMATVSYGQSCPARVEDETSEVNSAHLPSIIEILESAGYEVTNEPPHEETDNYGVPCCTTAGKLRIYW